MFIPVRIPLVLVSVSDRTFRKEQSIICFQIFVDSAANLPAVIAKKYNIHVISFVNLISGKEVTCYNPDLSPEEERQKGTEYYNAMRDGCEIKNGAD